MISDESLAGLDRLTMNQSKTAVLLGFWGGPSLGLRQLYSPLICLTITSESEIHIEP